MKLSVLALGGVLQCVAAAPDPLAIPFHQTFGGPPLDPGWHVDVSPGNSVTVADGALKIAARDNTFAHLERPLGVERIRAACTLKPRGGVSWVCSLFVYWDARNWCQVSVLTDGPSFYAVQLVDGRLQEHRRPVLQAAEWYQVAVVLADDFLRFQSRNESEAWRNWLTLPRPAAWKDRPPALLIIGKGFSREEAVHQPFTAADLDNDFTEPGSASVSWVRSVTVEPASGPDLEWTEQERREAEEPLRDWLGESELSAASDPSFASVSRHCPPMKHPREALGVKDGPQEVVVLPDGALEFDGVRAEFRVAVPTVAPGTIPLTRRLHDGYLPIVTTAHTRDGLEFEQTTFAWSPGQRPDAPLSVFVRLQVANLGTESREVPMAFAVGEAEVKWKLELPAGGTQRAFVAVPFDRPADAKRIEAVVFDLRFEETAAWWKAYLAQGMSIQVPEEAVNHAWRTWLAYNFINVDQRGSVFEPHDGGGGCYELVYGYSASRYCYALDLMGYHADAQRYLDSILTFVSPDGLLIVNYGLPDTGTQLWAMGRHYQMTRDAAWLRKVAPTMIRMCDWILAARRSSMAQQSPDSPCYGLLKYQPYCDEPEPAYSYHSDTYLALGMRETARALEAIGENETASRLARESAAYEADILRSMDRAVLERNGMKMLPVFPETRALLERVRYTGADYYSLVSCMVLEAGLLPARDPRARLITDLLEKRGGLILGTSAFQGGIDHAYTYGYWMNCLERDEVKRVILGFYTALAYGMSRGTYSGVEVTFLRTGENQPTLPHLYSGTQQLLLLRNMLLREDGDALWIGQAVPRPWLAAGKEIRVDRAPTFFGQTSYRIRSDEDARTITVELDPPVRQLPEVIHVRLRHPDDRAIRRVAVNGQPHSGFTRDTVTLRGVRSRAVIQTRYDLD